LTFADASDRPRCLSMLRPYNLMAQSHTFTCPNCGAPQQYSGGASTIQCPYCHTTIIVPAELRSGTLNVSAFSTTDWGKQANALLQIKQLVDEGKLIDAIKLYRETFGTGLAESKLAIDAMQLGRNVQIVKLGGAPGSYQVNTPAGNIEINTTANGYQVNMPAALRTGTSCGTIFVLVIVLIVVASVAVPLFFAGSDLLNVFASPTVAIPTIDTSFIPKFGTPTGVTTKTRVPTVTPTPGFASVIHTFGKAGTAAGQLTDARSIAVDTKGNIFIGGYSDPRIQRFNSNGQFQDQWTLAPKTILTGLAADFRGNLYAVDDGTIYKFNAATGDRLGTLDYSGGNRFDDMAIMPDGSVIATWYEEREGLITSIEGHRDDLVFFDRNGKFTKSVQGIVSAQTGNVEIFNKLAVDGQGNIYVLTSDDGIFKFSPDGKYENRFGSVGNEPGQINGANSIATDGQGRIYVAFGNKIAVYAADGRYLSTIEGIQNSELGIAFDSNDHLWAVAQDKFYELALNK
jgi:LSD1 subclass zinc finger protein